MNFKTRLTVCILFLYLYQQIELIYEFSYKRFMNRFVHSVIYSIKIFFLIEKHNSFIHKGLNPYPYPPPLVYWKGDAMESKQDEWNHCNFLIGKHNSFIHKGLNLHPYLQLLVYWKGDAKESK